jgi:hypothetical protein
MGDIRLAEAMMWALKNRYEESFKNNYEFLHVTAARHAPDAAYHLMLALQRQGYDVGIIAARILEHLHALLPSEDPSPPEPEDSPQITEKPLATPALQLESLEFYESDKDDRQKEMLYRLRFPHETTCFVYYKLTVRNRLYKQRDQTYELVDRYYNPDGSLLAADPPYNWVITSDTEQTWLTGGRGWDEPGHWEPGDYRVEILIDGVIFAKGSFKILKPRRRRR